MKTKEIAFNSLYVLRLDHGDDVLLSIRKAARELGIRNGVIVNGAGSVKDFHYHDVGTRLFPVPRSFSSGSEPADIISVSGFILDGEVHCHISFGQPGKSFGGHLEEGSIILTFGAITIASIDENLKGLDTPKESTEFQ